MAGAGAVVGIGILVVLFIIFIWIAIVALAILSMIFWIFMIVDVVKRKFKEENEKVIWILVIVLAGIIGALVYYFVVKNKDNKK